MERNLALKILTQYRNEFGPRHGIISLGIFGSTAKGNAVEKSDVDVVVSLKKPNLFTLSRIRLDLEEQLKHPVDIVNYRKNMNPFLKERINQDVCYV